MDNADFIDRCFEICKNIGNRCWTIISGYMQSTHEADFDYDLGVAFMLALIILFFVGSACWAASIAACRRYMQIPHFLLGLVLPWIYPAVILFALDIKGQKQMRLAAEQERLEREAAEAERQKNIALNTAGQEVAEKVENTGFNQERFMAIFRNVDGTNPGPWNVVFSGNEMHVIRIIEVLPELISVEVQAENGQTFTMRIPYAKMESWENA